MKSKFISVFLASWLIFGNAVAAVEKTNTGAAPSKGLSGTGFSDPSLAGNLIQTTLGLLLVLLVIGAAAWGVKRFGHFQAGAQGRMKVVGGLSLGTRERVVLLQVGEQQLLVGVAPGTIQTLHVLAEPLPSDHKPDAPSGFAARLQSVMAGQVKKPVSSRADDSNAGGDK
jgi:flagellar protein FliO/FliZ